MAFNILLAGEALRLTAPVHVLTGGAPPTTAMLDRIERIGFKVTHSYGLTEAGPTLAYEWRHQWDLLPLPERSHLKARQGGQHPLSRGCQCHGRR